MKEVKLTVIIERPAHEVFDFTLNPENTPKWIDGIVKEVAEPLPARVGTTYKNQNHEGIWTEYEITALEPGRMFVLSRKDGAYHVKYTLTPAKGQTELEYVEWTDDGELEDPFTQEPLQRLKEIMEALRRPAYRVVRKSEASVRQIADNKTASNYITKDISSNVSLATTEASDYYERETTTYDRIYFVLEGEMKLTVQDEEITLGQDDACFISKGTSYEMSGSFKAVTVNQPAFGS